MPLHEKKIDHSNAALSILNNGNRSLYNGIAFVPFFIVKYIRNSNNSENTEDICREVDIENVHINKTNFGAKLNFLFFLNARL